MEINERKREIGQECVDKFIENDFYGAAILPTGAGKTWIMLKCMSELFERDKINSVLYTCNSINLRDEDFPNEVKKWGYEKHLKNMQRLCYQSAYKLEGQSFDLGLIDEGDFSLTPEYIKLFLNNSFKYLIFVSATLEPEKLKLLKSLKPNVPIIYKKEMSDLENENVLNKSKYYYVNFMLTMEENNRYLRYNKAISSLLNKRDCSQKDLEFVLRQRKLFMNSLKSSAQICRSLLRHIDGRSLVFSELTDQSDRVCEFTYHGKNEGEENLLKFENEEINELGVCGKVDRGVNIKRVENVVLESCSSSKTKIVQKLGRGKRLLVDEFLNVYMLIPHYKQTRYDYYKRKEVTEIKPTIVLSWLEKALKDFNIPKIEVFKF